MLRKTSTALCSRAGALRRPVCLLPCIGATTSRLGVSAQLVSAAPTHARRFYVAQTRLCRDEASASSGQQQQQAAAGASSTNESALEVAIRANKLKKVHQTGGAGTDKKGVEQEAWQTLNSLTEDQINNAEGKAVSLLLNAWAYFAKYWAKGKDGPL